MIVATNGRRNNSLADYPKYSLTLDSQFLKKDSSRASRNCNGMQEREIGKSNQKSVMCLSS